MKTLLPAGVLSEVHGLDDQLARIHQILHITRTQFYTLWVSVIVVFPVLAQDGNQCFIKIWHSSKFRVIHRRLRHGSPQESHRNSLIGTPCE